MSLPKLEALRGEQEGNLQLIGLTALYGQEKDDAEWFIVRNKLGFPNAIFEGDVFKDLGFTGIPMAVAVREGKVVWKGHPDGISEAFLEGLVQGRLGEF
jgi:hypothetical protein